MAPSATSQHEISEIPVEKGKDGKEITALEAISQGDTLPGRINNFQTHGL